MTEVANSRRASRLLTYLPGLVTVLWLAALNTWGWAPLWVFDYLLPGIVAATLAYVLVEMVRGTSATNRLFYWVGVSGLGLVLVIHFVVYASYSNLESF